MNQLSQYLPTAMFALAIVVAIVLLMRRSRGYTRRLRKDRNEGPLVQLPRPEQPATRSAMIVSDDLARQEVELHDRARRLMGQLDTKIRVLQQLIQQSQRQIDRLESLSEHSTASVDPYQQPQREQR